MSLKPTFVAPDTFIQAKGLLKFIAMLLQKQMMSLNKIFSLYRANWQFFIGSLTN